LTYILGLNAYHGDSSACLIRNGEILAAAEEERFKRVKHYAGFPSDAIAYCLAEVNIPLKDVEYVAINSDPTANRWNKIKYALTHRLDIDLIKNRLRTSKRRRSISDEFENYFGHEEVRFKLHRVEHHLAHLSSAFHVSPYQKAVVVSVDGLGDFASAAWGIGDNGAIRMDGKVLFPHSLGLFYQALTKFLGFQHYGDEYKVMGLAPYGKPDFIDKMRQTVLLQNDGTFRLNLDYFWHHRESVEYKWVNGVPVPGRLFSDNLGDFLGLKPRRENEKLTQQHMNLARSIQVMYEEAFFHLLNALHGRYGTDSLCLAGGCAMNSVANGKIARNTPFKKIYIQSAAGDAGGAIGAAYTVWHQLKNGKRNYVMDHAYLGPHSSNAEIKELISVEEKRLNSQGCHVQYIEDEEDLCRRVANHIAEGKVIGWFQGRMEWGPRALGNRSILGDPRRKDMKDILNIKIKRRESFRPFAPSILRERVLDWFEEDDEVPFMMKVFQIREGKRAEIPAVTHTDGSGRLQTVYQHTNPRYYQLIRIFEELTGVPILLNTSFNENEPVVCMPKEALECFLRTNMDMLVLENWCVERSQ